MPKFEFRFLCVDDKKSTWNLVKSTIKDFKVKSVGKHLPYDHIGIINLENYNEAIKRLHSLKDENIGKIINMSVIMVGE